MGNGCSLFSVGFAVWGSQIGYPMKQKIICSRIKRACLAQGWRYRVTVQPRSKTSWPTSFPGLFPISKWKALRTRLVPDIGFLSRPFSPFKHNDWEPCRKTSYFQLGQHPAPQPLSQLFWCVYSVSHIQQEPLSTVSPFLWSHQNVRTSFENNKTIVDFHSSCAIYDRLIF